MDGRKGLLPGPGRWWRWLCAAALGAVLLVAPASAVAAPGLLAPETLPASGSADFGVQTAMAPNGFAIAGWLEVVDPTHTAIRVATRPPGGPWSAAQQLDVTTQMQTLYPLSLAVDSAGDAAIAWDDDQPGLPTHDTAEVASRAAGQGSFGPVQATPGALDPVLGIDGAGHVTMIDDELDGASHDVVDRVWAAGGSPPTVRSDLLATGCAPTRAPSVLAVAPDGDAIAGAECTGDTFIRRIAGVWKPPTTPASDTSSGACPFPNPTSSRGQQMTVAIDPSGDVGGAFVEDSSTTDCATFITSDAYSLQLITGTPSGGTTTTGAVDTAFSSGPAIGFSISGPDAAIAPGVILLAWRNGGLTTTTVRSRLFDFAGNATGPMQTLATSSFTGPIDVAMNPSGAALAVYSTTDSSALQFATKAPGASSFSAPVALAEAPSQGPAVAIDDAGDGVAVFASGHTGSAVAQARGFDATPPSIDGASIPGAAQTGTSVAFTAQASDMWGPVTLSWDFGDGTPIATGASVTHTFAAAGTHTVTVTATDAVGNASSKTGSIAVATALVRPTISKASIKPKRFQAGHKAVFTFTLNEEAGVTITIARQQRAKHHRRRFKRTGALSGPGLVGVNHIRFTGKVGRRTLKPGRYRATLIATAGHAKSPPISLSFTILRAG